MKTLLLPLLIFSTTIVAEAPKLVRELDDIYGTYLAEVSPDLHFFALTRNTDVLVYDLQTGDFLFEVFAGRKDHGVDVYHALIFSADSSELLVGCGDGYLRSYSTSTGTLVSEYPVSSEALQSISVVPEKMGGDSLVFITTKGSFSFYRHSSSQLLARFPAPPSLYPASDPDPEPIGRFISALHPDGTLAAVGDKLRSEIRLYDLVAGREILRSNGDPFYRVMDPLPGESINFQSKYASRLQFIKGSDSLYVLIWQHRANTEWIEIGVHTHVSRQIGSIAGIQKHAPFHAMSPTSERLVIGSPGMKCSAKLIDRKTDYDLARPRPILYSTSVAISADGHFALTFGDESLNLWELP